MSKFESMSDFEINKLVAKHIGWIISNAQYDQNDVVVIGRFSPFDTTVDYCNSWGDMGEVIEEHKISLRYGVNNKNMWLVSCGCFERYSYEHANPLRAAAIIYLESLEAQNV